MSKQREDLDSEDEPDLERREKQDDQEHVEVSEKDGKTEVKLSGETRRERRQREIREERSREIESAVNPLKDSLAATQRMLQDALARIQAPQQQQAPQRSPVDDVDDQYIALSEKQEAILAKIRLGSQSQEALEKLRRDYYRIDREKAAVAAKPVATEAMRGYRPPQGPSAYEQQLASDHPEAWYNEEARNYAAQLAQTKQAEIKASGRPITPAVVKQIHNESLTRAAEVWGLRRPAIPAASDGQRQRFIGSSATGKSPGGPITRQLSTQEREMAVAMSPHMSEADACARWAKLAHENGV
jgi:hypothetical protein